MSLFDTYPGLRRAALAIAYDNGMINAEQSEAEFLDATAALLVQDLSGDRIPVEMFLASLNDDEIDLVCAAAEHEVDEFLAERRATPAVYGYLCAIFEGTWGDEDDGPATAAGDVGSGGEGP